MNILLTGARGFLGAALREALLGAGHNVAAVVRPGSKLYVTLPTTTGILTVIELDYASALDADAWRTALEGIDVVINTVGIFREAPGQSFERIHSQAPVALFDACAAVGGIRVIQLSALGAEMAGAEQFLASKKVADDHLLALAIPATVVRPSLVYAPDGPSAMLFNGLATLPVVVVPASGDPLLQPVHRDDVVAGLVLLATASAIPAAPRVIAFTGRDPIRLSAYVASLRRQLGFPARPRVWRLPEAVMTFAVALAEKMPGSLVTRSAVAMLVRGNTADAAPFMDLLGHEPRSVDVFIPPRDAAFVRQQALLGWLLPGARLSLASVWLWTAAVSAGLYPVTESYALLGQTGIHGALATVSLYGAAALDLLLGLGTLLLRPRLRRPLWLVQLALILSYTLIISIYLPGYWLHPYGPIVKNIPMLMLILTVYMLEPGQLKGKESSRS
ncbi:MAG: hypothetical protein JWQ72_1373 [Polaromonas sp.]|nr:hypothetical protein [Polaromonas sp.]